MAIETTKKTALVKSNVFDTLMEEIGAYQEKKSFARACENRRLEKWNRIRRRTDSVFFFLLHVAGMDPKREITLEEAGGVYEQLRGIGFQKLREAQQ